MTPPSRMLESEVMDPVERLRELPQIEPPAAVDARVLAFSALGMERVELGRFERGLYATVAAGYAVYAAGQVVSLLFG